MIDKKFAKIGFIKVRDNKYGTTYERQDTEYGFTQVLDILHKASGNHLVMSYDKDLGDVVNIGNTCCGLTYYEMKLVLKKMKKRGWHKRKGC